VLYKSEKPKSFLPRFELYMTASGAITKEEEVKVEILLHVIGEEALEKFNTFNLSEKDKKNFNSVITAFEAFCVPKTNETIECQVFFTRSQLDYYEFI
jgi:hypothetical protein